MNLFDMISGQNPDILLKAVYSNEEYLKAIPHLKQAISDIIIDETEFFFRTPEGPDSIVKIIYDTNTKKYNINLIAAVPPQAEFSTHPDYNKWRYFALLSIYYYFKGSAKKNEEYLNTAKTELDRIFYNKVKVEKEKPFPNMFPNFSQLNNTPNNPPVLPLMFGNGPFERLDLDGVTITGTSINSDNEEILDRLDEIKNDTDFLSGSLEARPNRAACASRVGKEWKSRTNRVKRVIRKR